MEMDEKIFHIFMTILCTFLGIIWKGSNAINVFLKIIFWAGAAWGALIVFKDLGYIIKG
jgi:hypothetical protein